MSEVDTSAEVVDGMVEIIMADMFDADDVADLLRALVAERDTLRAQLSTARADALEEAAKSVDRFRDEFKDHHNRDFFQGTQTQAIGCAASIRYLKEYKLGDGE